MIDGISKIFSRPWSRRWLCLVYLGLAVFVMRGVLFAPGALGLRNDWWIMPLPGEMASYVQHIRSAWLDSGLGMAYVRSGSHPFVMVLSMASLVLGMSAASLSKLIPLLAIAGAGLGANVLIFLIIRRSLPAFFGSLIYMFSPLVFNLVVTGDVHFMVSYALFPLLIVTFRQALTAERSPSWIIVSALLFALLKDNVQVASLLILLPLWLAVVGFGQPSGRPGRSLARVAAFGLLVALIQAPFVLPAVFQFQEYRTYAQQVVQFSFSRLVGPDLVNAFTLDGAGYRYFNAAIPQLFVPWLTAGRIALFALALSALVWRSYRRDALLWSAVALVSLFLFKGVNPPFGVINQWLLDHVWLMTAFRNVQYFTMLTNLALAVLLGIWIASFLKAVSVRWRLSFGFYGLLLVVLLVLVYPYLGGNFNGEIQTYTLHSDYASLIESARREVRDGRWLLLPPAQPMRYRDRPFAGLDPLGLRVPTAISPAAEQPWQRLLTMLLYTASPIRPEQLLCDGAVHTAVARRDFTSETPQFSWDEFPRATWTNEQLQQSITGWDKLTERQRLADGQATLYGVSQPCGRLIAAAQATLSSGTLSDVVDLVEYSKEKKLPTDPILYTSQQVPGLLTRLPAEAIKRVSLVQNNLLDVTRLFLSNAIEVPITNLTRDAKQGWSPLNGWWWKDWHYAAVLDSGAVVATGRQTGRAVFTVKQPGPTELWIKAMRSRSGSTLTVGVDGAESGQVTTYEPLLQGLVWTRLPLGRVTAGQHTVTVKSGDGENLLARLLVVPVGDAAQAERASAQWLFDRDVVLALTLATKNLAAYPGVFGVEPSGQSDESRKLSLTVPRDGSYTVSVKAATNQYVSAASQLESDYLEYIAEGKRVGQIFELASGVQLLHSLTFKLEARYPGSSVAAPSAPDAPLTLTVYRLNPTGVAPTLVAQASVPPELAPVNDQWKMIEIPLDSALAGQGGRFLAELSSPATRVGWAAATVNDGFGGVADHYAAGTMTVGDEPQQRDLVFTVQTQIGSPELARLQFDDHVLPLTLSESWQELGSIELLAGSHTVVLPVNNPHLHLDQIFLRSAGTLQHGPQPPVLTYRRTRPTSLQMAQSVNGQASYWLILKDSWHNGWQTRPRSNYHLVVNGFANAWWIEPPSGPYHVSVRYTPQRYTDVGLIISGVTFFSLVGWLGWLYRNKLSLTRRWRGYPSARTQGILVVLVLIALIGWRIASQLDRLASRQAIQPPVVSTGQ